MLRVQYVSMGQKSLLNSHPVSWRWFNLRGEVCWSGYGLLGCRDIGLDRPNWVKTNKTEQNQEECEGVKVAGAPLLSLKSLCPLKSPSPHARYFFEFFRRAGEGGGGRGERGGMA